MEEIKKKQAISLPEVKEILQKEDPEKLDQIQRWTYDYVTNLQKLMHLVQKKQNKDW